MNLQGSSAAEVTTNFPHPVQFLTTSLDLFVGLGLGLYLSQVSHLWIKFPTEYAIKKTRGTTGTSEHGKELLFLSESSVFHMRQKRRTHLPSSGLQRRSEVSRCFQEGRGRELTCALKDPRVLTKDLRLTERLQRSQVLDLRCIHQPGRKEEGSPKLICKQVISWFPACVPRTLIS